MKLEDYKKKRDFSKTPEPTGKTGTKKNIFVIQKHYASRLHFDFRIEHKNVLVSWAVPKGLPTDTKTKRLAIQTEDHPYDYAAFEGVIPEGYGAGTVYIWDEGTYENKGPEISKGLKEGHLKVKLNGKKLHDEYALTKTNKGWMVVKTSKEEKPELSKNIQISNPEKKIFTHFTKQEYLSYYYHAAERILPHLRDRPLSLYRFPEGASKKGFFQKDKPEYFPKWIESIKIKSKEEKNKTTEYILCNTIDSLIYLANHVGEFHIWNTTQQKPTIADRMIFDLDPTPDITRKQLLKTAHQLHDFLKELHLEPYIMTTGGKGYHIITPLTQDTPQDDVSAFAKKIATILEQNIPHTTTEQRKEKRGKNIFIDTYRNSRTQTAICPYSVRAKPEATIATPITWDELEETKPDYFTLKNIKKRLEQEDPWQNFFNEGISLKKVLKRLE